MPMRHLFVHTRLTNSANLPRGSIFLHRSRRKNKVKCKGKKEETRTSHRGSNPLPFSRTEPCLGPLGQRGSTKTARNYSYYVFASSIFNVVNLKSLQPAKQIKTIKPVKSTNAQMSTLQDQYFLGLNPRNDPFFRSIFDKVMRRDKDDN
jgi:hypothetical protein